MISPISTLTFIESGSYNVKEFLNLVPSWPRKDRKLPETVRLCNSWL